MRPSEIVALFLLVNLALIGVYDVFAYWRIGHHATVSAVIREWAASWPAMPFLAGLLAGHLFLS
jgi:hypothetical protein